MIWHTSRTLAAMRLMLIVLLATVGLATSTDKQECEPGWDCTLNCLLEGTGPIELAKWTRDDLDPKVVYLYSDGNPSLGQNPKFKNRVRLSPEGMKSGNATLIIIDVKKSDEGIYTCYVKPKQSSPSRRKRAVDAIPISTIQLVVNDPAEETDNAHSGDAVHRGRMSLFLSIGLIAVAACVVGVIVFRRKVFPMSQHQPAKFPTEEQV